MYILKETTQLLVFYIRATCACMEVAAAGQKLHRLLCFTMLYTEHRDAHRCVGGVWIYGVSECMGGVLQSLCLTPPMHASKIGYPL